MSEDDKNSSPKKTDERQDLTTLHERTIATLSYVSFLAVIPFYLRKDSEFCQFHGRQGMLLAIVFFIASLLTVIDFLFDLIIIIQIGLFFFMGFAALSGRWKKIPFGYDWAVELGEALALKSKDELADEEKFGPDEEPKEEEAKAKK